MSDMQDETTEAQLFRLLSQSVQRALLDDYPLLLAKLVHGYSRGVDCEVLMQTMLEGSTQLMRIRNSQGDQPIASALVHNQPERANWLTSLAAERNPSALMDRTKYRETLLMLSTTSLPIGLIESQLKRDPSEVYRLYDTDGRNLLHHCALEDSTEALEIVLTCVSKLMAEGRLESARIEEAVDMNDRNGDTPMHLMALRNQPQMLRLLLSFARENDISVNLDSPRHGASQWTPLMAAAKADAVDAFDFLIASGADLDLLDAEGCSVAELVDQAGQPRVTALLSRLQPDLAAPWLRASDAVCCAKSFTSAGALESVDSGIQSVQTPCKERQQAQQQSSRDDHPGLWPHELDALEAWLMRCGKSADFLEAVRRLSRGKYPEPMLLTGEKPLTTEFSVWSHEEPVPRELVRRALIEVGECAAADRVV